MNKQELVASIQERTGLTKQKASQVHDAFFASIKEALSKDDTVKVYGFGIFGTRMQAERQARNPKTNEPIVIPARKRIYFKASDTIQPD